MRIFVSINTAGLLNANAQIEPAVFDPIPLKGKTLNGLVAGKYLIVVHAYGQEAGDELEQEKVITVI